MYQIIVVGLLVSVVGGAMYFSYSNGSVDTVQSLYENPPNEPKDKDEVSLDVQHQLDASLEGFESDQPSSN